MTDPDERDGFLTRRARRLRRRFSTRLRNYFLAGVLVTAPLTITVWLALQIVEFFDSTVRNLIPASYNPELHLPFSIPGIGVLVFLIGITLIGALTAGLLGRFFMRTAERLVNSMPVVRTIYNALKQIFETVLKTKTDAFRHVVLIEYPRRGIWCLGFLSGETEGEVQNLTDEAMLNVFLPTTPNPTSGFLLFLPKRDVIILRMTVEEGIKMVVSGGLVTPKDPRPLEEQARPQVHVQPSLERVVADESFSAENRSHTTGP
jgi:uncharacterized membrane protein